VAMSSVSLCGGVKRRRGTGEQAAECQGGSGAAACGFLLWLDSRRLLDAVQAAMCRLHGRTSCTCTMPFQRPNRHSACLLACRNQPIQGKAHVPQTVVSWSSFPLGTHDTGLLMRKEKSTVNSLMYCCTASIS
jgi:hypothetical protein